MKTQETKTPDSLGAAHGSATVLDEYVRIDKVIRDCENSMLVAERLKARGHNLPEREVDAVRLKLSEAMVERDFLDEWMRRAKSPNVPAMASADEKTPPKETTL